MQRAMLTAAGLLSVALLACGGCQQPGSVAAFVAAQGQANGSTSDERVAVTVVHPARKTLTRTTTQPGRIEAFEQTPIYAKIEGYVRKTRTARDKSGKPVERELADMGDRVE